MNNFLIEHYSLITHFVEILAAVTGILLFNKYKGSSTKYFIYFLVFIALSELASRYTFWVQEGELFSFLDGTVFQRNYWWGTLFWSLGSVMFYSFFFLKIIKTKRFRIILNVSRYSFLVFFWSNRSYTYENSQICSYVDTLMCIDVDILICSYVDMLIWLVEQAL